MKIVQQKEINLDNIYNKLINLSEDISECKQSIHYIEDMVTKSHWDIRDQLKDIMRELKDLQKNHIEMQAKREMFWNLAKLTPSNIAKWLSSAVLFGVTIGTADKINLMDLVKNLLN